MHLTQMKTKSHQIGAKDYKDCFIITKKYHLNYAFNHHLTHIYIYNKAKTDFEKHKI